MSALQNLVGKIFGRLHVQYRITGAWVCVCSCGNVVEVHSRALTLGRTKSCGCYRREQLAVIGRGHRRHGHTPSGMESPEYRAWRSMKARCYRKKNVSYKRYGGRGIRVCERWLKFENFLADVGLRPSPAHSLERKENNGNYEPGNVVWATQLEQHRNKSSAPLLTLNGETLMMSEWARRLGVHPSQISARLAKGWPLVRALTEPPRTYSKAS